jgi:hypothetical protein
LSDPVIGLSRAAATPDARPRVSALALLLCVVASHFDEIFRGRLIHKARTSRICRSCSMA